MFSGGYIYPVSDIQSPYTSPHQTMDSSTHHIVQLRTLLALIGNAVQVAERHLSNAKLSAHEQPVNPELRTSVYTIEAACAQLCALVARPSDTLMNVGPFNFYFLILSLDVVFEVEIHGSQYYNISRRL